MNLIESLKWRYSVKKYSNRKVNDAAIKSITEAINLHASSAGLQPYRVIVVEHAGIRQQLAKGGFNPQVTEASHLLVFAAIEDLAAEHIDEYMQRMADTRGVPVEALGEEHPGGQYYLKDAGRESYMGHEYRTGNRVGSCCRTAYRCHADGRLYPGEV